MERSDRDGIQDALEEGIPGITVTLYASDGVTAISSAVTNASGYYSFVNLTPDTYVVGFSNIPENAFLVHRMWAVMTDWIRMRMLSQAEPEQSPYQPESIIQPWMRAFIFRKELDLATMCGWI
ncbi:MAG: carboxypeptidase regulatory-like domain-containing protein [Bacteroidota bacterium]|nr:MAG: carboxypeptidase regulatory-like domain-containing protein [Bacteroidota bacterium]